MKEKDNDKEKSRVNSIRNPDIVFYSFLKGPNSFFVRTDKLFGAISKLIFFRK